MRDINKLKSIAAQVRRDIVRQVHSAKSGHPGGSLGCADYFTALYFDIMKHTPKPFDITGKDQDVFVLSNGHLSPVFYSALARSGYFDVSELATFRQINSRLQGHPTTHEGLPGVRVATGSLGQGLSVAVGIAQGKKLDKENNLVYALCGDGEIQEGQIWEAVMYAAHNKVDNLIATVDFNGQQIDGPTKDIMGFHSIKEKFDAFDWLTLECDGNDMEDLTATLDKAKAMAHKGKPIMIIMKTEMGAGVDYMMGSHKWHGIAPNDEQLAKAMEQLAVSEMGDY